MTSIGAHIRRNGLLIAIGAIAFFATCLAAAPASLLAHIAGAQRYNIAYQNVEGTIWRGRYAGLSVNGAPLGDVDYELSALSLLTLSPRVKVKSVGGAAQGEGVFSVSLNKSVSIIDSDFDIDLGPFARKGVLGMPVQGEAQIKISKARISPRGCRQADGVIWTNMLEAPARYYDVQGFPMTGAIRCEDQDLLIALSGGGSNGDADLIVRVTPDLTYVMTATARPNEDQVAEALLFFGFEDKNGELTYGSTGVLRGVGS